MTIPCHIIFLIIGSFFCGTNCFNDHELYFEKTAILPKKTLGMLDYDPKMSFIEPEDRRKLCFYAAVKAEFPFLGYNYDPEWWRYLPLSENHDRLYNYVLPCKGIPNFYLLRKEREAGRIEIAFIESAADDYEIKPGFATATSVKRRDDMIYKLKNTDATEMNIEGRKSLCARASKHLTNVPLYFWDKYVGEAYPYEFNDENKSEIYIAISCSTSPALYIRFRKSSNEVELVLHKSGIDLYEFEEDKYEPLEVSLASEDEKPIVTLHSSRKVNPEDRLKLCILARRRHILSTFVVDKEVSEANIYAFQYAGEQEKRYNPAILCSATPTLYLQFVDEHKIKFTSITPTSIFSISRVLIVEEVNGKGKKKDKSDLQKQSFDKLLDAKARWDVCYTAQKYIMDAGSRWRFRFTRKERILEPFKLLLSPECIGDPDVYEIQTRKSIEEYEEDIVYMCTRWPEMYIRRTQTDNELEILLISREVISSE